MKCRHVVASVMACGMIAGVGQAENIVFPPDAGVVDITMPPYSAAGDGRTDDTAAIQKGVDDHRGRNRTLYFPNGTYLISRGVGIFNGTAHSRDRFLTWQGQSEAKTIIKLRDQAPGFTDASQPQIVVSVYQGNSTGDAMHSYVRNLTVDVGRGNPGAVGLRFLTNNTGAMERVTIRSSDPNGAGHIGLDMRQSQNGPGLISHVTVDGFDYGVQTGNSFAFVYEHLNLRNQRVVGFDNVNARTTIRDLVSNNAVTAVRNRQHGQLFLFGAQLKGGGRDAVAIVSENRRALLRDVSAEGYAHTVRTRDGKRLVGRIDLWMDGRAYSLFNADPVTLGLEVKETPRVPWEQDLRKWQKVDNRESTDVTEALQAAIDQAAATGGTTVYFPNVFDHNKPDDKNRGYLIAAPIRVHGSVNRIIGLSGVVDVVDRTGAFKQGEAVFTLEDLTDTAIVFERFFLLGGWDCPEDAVMFENRSGSRVVLKNLNQRGVTKKADPGGEWYLEDYSPSRQSTLRIGRAERVWARQFNPETPRADMVHVDGGQFWCLGLKTEGRTTHVIVENGGRAEVLGGVVYQSWARQPLDPPLFIIRDAEASFSIGLYHSVGHGLPFTTIVEETRDGQTRSLLRSELDDYHLPLYRSGGH